MKKQSLDLTVSLTSIKVTGNRGEGNYREKNYGTYTKLIRAERRTGKINRKPSATRETRKGNGAWCTRMDFRMEVT